ncbi:MAG: hypothetical protein DRP02_09710 [Candidatus Gerdarchaeota archaeon]|nr:MAG: hypothetical protein DRO63_02825 [Candidatus Gerdarchaeota archaeon]RLI69840.1 MAG: hypothetical protein DRP02_09710 [Candidatus Gerdarchaeota archaeon]
MKRGLKITLIVLPIILIIAGGSAVVGTLLYTKNNVSHSTGDATITSYILPSFTSYTGYIVVSVPIEIINNGLYNIVDMQISLKVYGQNFSISSLNGILLGEGVNAIAEVAKGTTYSGMLEINMTENIAVLAIQDGEMHILVETSLKLDMVLFKIGNSFTEEQIKPWDSPFGV